MYYLWNNACFPLKPYDLGHKQGVTNELNHKQNGMVVKAEEMRGVFAKAQLQTKWENGKILRNKQWTCLNSLEKKKNSSLER